MIPLVAAMVIEVVGLVCRMICDAAYILAGTTTRPNTTTAVSDCALVTGISTRLVLLDSFDTCCPNDMTERNRMRAEKSIAFLKIGLLGLRLHRIYNIYGINQEELFSIAI